MILLENETSRLDDVDSSWLALLFAVLACGVQFSNDPIKERDLRCKVFSEFNPRPPSGLDLIVSVCSSFQCLRASNFFNNTNMNQIQAKALIGNCLRNNLDTNSAWILMGLYHISVQNHVARLTSCRINNTSCAEYRTT